MSERRRAPKDRGSCVGRPLRSTEAAGRGEAVPAQQDAGGDEAARWSRRRGGRCPGWW